MVDTAHDVAEGADLSVRPLVRAMSTARRAIATPMTYAVFVAALVLAWQIVVWVASMPPYVLPGPVLVATSFLDNLPSLTTDSEVTLWESLLGFLISLAAGGGLAAAMVYSKMARRFALPLLSLLNATPKVALAPLLVIWLGLEVPSKVAMAALIGFFPIVINSYRGLNDVDPDQLRLFRLLRASEFQTFVKLRLPNSVPAVFDGIKVAVPLTIIGAIVGEFVAAEQGIGYEIDTASSNFDMALMFASVLTIAVLTTLIFQLTLWIERRLLRWQPSPHKT